MNEIITAISTVGFPIVMCLLMFYMNEKQDVRHTEETAKITEAVNELKLVVNQLISIINERDRSNG